MRPSYCASMLRYRYPRVGEHYPRGSGLLRGCFPLTPRAEMRATSTKGDPLDRAAAPRAGLPRAPIGIQRVCEIPRLPQYVTFIGEMCPKLTATDTNSFRSFSDRRRCPTKHEPSGSRFRRQTLASAGTACRHSLPCREHIVGVVNNLDRKSNHRVY